MRHGVWDRIDGCTYLYCSDNINQMYAICNKIHLPFYAPDIRTVYGTIIR